MNLLLAFLLSATMAGSSGVCEPPIVAPTVNSASSAIMQMETCTDTAAIEAEPRVEQTVWYERIYNGKLQKRLWSITNGCWLTDWIDV